MKLSLICAKKLFAAIVLAIAALVFLMIPVDTFRIHDEFLRLMLTIGIVGLIVYIFYVFRKALKEACYKSVKNTIRKFEPDFIFPDEPNSEKTDPDN